MGGSCVTCGSTTGAFHDQMLSVGGETRHYFLYVPSAYQCDRAWPLLVDFHGTGSGSDPSANPEEYYAHEELVALAEREGFLLLRPRSRYLDEGGGVLVFRWDENPGDLAKNTAFAHALVTDLSSRYRVDPARTYASGFSNGTNMAMQFAGESVFHGFGLVGGGVWDRPTRGRFDADAPRIYATTGYRDYLFKALRDLKSWLDGLGYPRERLFQRQSDTGHDLYGWHFAEMWAWLDRGERPAQGSLAAGWTREDSGGSESLLEVVHAPGGGLVASGAAGTLWRRAPDGTWSRNVLNSGSVSPNFTDLCVLPSGHGAAVGEGTLALTHDGGASWQMASPVPEFDNMGFGFSYLNSIGCGSDELVGGGYWAAAQSRDDGTTWSAASTSVGTGNAQTAIVRAGPAGTWLAAGYYDYVGRSTDGHSFTSIDHALPSGWWNGIAAGADGRWWVVGEQGSLLYSTDDGRSFQAQPLPRADDLYAVDFADPMHGLAVGAHGAALLTEDGGASWRDVSTGLDGFLGGVAWLGPASAVVVGQDGLALRFDR
jgi:photosystem II stability/assembly factor-like uncharacterized protein/predicted esterase